MLCAFTLVLKFIYLLFVLLYVPSLVSGGEFSTIKEFQG